MTTPLSPELWSQLEPWLARALDIEPEQRSSWLKQNCSDSELRDELLELLCADTCPARDVLDVVRDGVLSSADRDGTQMGPFELLRRLGTGGMGEVYLAQRTGVDYEQQVALKLMRGSRFDPAEIERFRRERRILARLSHPNIARLIEGGMDDCGTPYLAMEYVDGAQITNHCNVQKLNLRARLTLFAQVFDVVQYAHDHLVVHLDLKPSNILVGSDGTLKLLDFGIAKLMGPDNADQEHAWRAAGLLTPSYAAPEQFRGGEVSTRTDVYSLGVLLYELLTGARPPRPDCGEAPQASSTVHAERVPPGMTPASLRRALRGDLDSILGRALRHDPEQRYGSAREFREDIARHLDKRVVHARPGTRSYRLTRFVSRNRLGFASASAISLILLLAISFSVNEAFKAKAAAVHSQHTYAQCEELQDFLLSVIRGTAPGTPPRNDVIDNMLVRGLALAGTKFDQQPVLQVDILTALGAVQRERNDASGAKTTLRHAYDLAHAHLGAASPFTLDAATNLAMALQDLGQPGQTITLLETALIEFREAGGKQNPQVVPLLVALSGAYAVVGDTRASVDIARQAEAAVKKHASLAVATRAGVYTALGHALFSAGNLEQSISPLCTALTLRRQQHHGAHEETVAALIALSRPLRKLGRQNEAETLLHEADAMRSEIARGMSAPQAPALFAEIVAVLDSESRINAVRPAAQTNPHSGT